MSHFTADICDKYPDAHVLNPGFISYGQKKMFSGKVLTIKADKNNGSIRTLVNSEGNGQVLVIDGQAYMGSALLGGNLAEAASQNHWAGVIINGCIRDTHEIAHTDLGVFALATNPKRPTREGNAETGIDITFGGITFSTGDTLYADLDGIVVIKNN